MKRVLFVAELGAGFGHVRRLLPLARAARAGGYHPTFLVANPREAGPLLAAEGFEVAETPFAAMSPAALLPGGHVAVSFADLLGAAGFAHRGYLQAVASAWDARLARIAPAAIVCEMSPILALAARGGAAPVLSLGHGFGLPPPHLSAFPILRDGKPAFDEGDLLANANHVCRLRGTAPMERLPELLAGTASAVTGLDLLDPYRELRREPAVGPPALDSGLATSQPSDDLFGYLLGDASPTEGILRAWVAAGLSGSVFVRRAKPLHRAITTGSKIRWLESPAPARTAQERARAVVHHGSMLTTEEALAGGRPQILAPLYLEHLLTARALTTNGLGRVVRPGSTPEQIGAALTSASAAEGPDVASAVEFARAYQIMAPAGDLPLRLLRRVLPSLGD